MDRDALARGARRRQAREALEFEREREAMLIEQLEDRLAEVEGPRLDEAAFAGMDPADAQLARDVLLGAPAEDLSEEDLGEFFADMTDPDEEEDRTEDEIARLDEELAACRRRQRALESYLVALGTEPGPG
jgi:hypothetical protein